MNIRLSKKDVIWSYIGTLMSMGSNLLMLPIIIYYLDADMLGLWYVFMSIGAITQLFDFGFALTFSRNITYCWSGASELKKESVQYTSTCEPNYLLMKEVLAACKSIYWKISGAALFVLLTFGLAYIYRISKSIAGNEHIMAWIIYSIAVFLNLYYGYYALFLRGVGAIDDANKNTVLSRAIQIVLTVILLSMGFGIIGVCVAYLSYGTTFRVLGKRKFYHFHNLGEKLKSVTYQISKSEIKSLIAIVWHNAWRDGLISISNYIANQATIFISSLYLTLAETGVYSLSVQIAMAIATLSGTIYMASQPQLQSAFVQDDKQLVRTTLSVSVMSFGYLFFIGLLLVVFICIPLLRLLRPDFALSISVLLGLCLYHFVLKYRDIFASYFSSTNRILYLRSFIFAAILCIVLSFIFLGYFKLGVWGLILAQLLSQLLYNAWHWPALAHREIELTPRQLVYNGSIELYQSVRKAVSSYLKR